MPRSWGKDKEECRKKRGRMAKASEKGLGQNWAVVALLMMMLFFLKITIKIIRGDLKFVCQCLIDE